MFATDSLTRLKRGENQFRSDYEFHSSAKGWFKFHKVPAKWNDARILCDFEGAVLASPLDASIADVMYSIIINKTEHLPFGIFTGFHNTYTPTKYHSMEGVPLVPVGKDQMFSEEYNSLPSCMRLQPQGGLVAGSCNDSLPFMCFKKKTAELKFTECGTVDELSPGWNCPTEIKAHVQLMEPDCACHPETDMKTRYQLDKRTGHCYKFHKECVKWPLAFLRCEAEGGHLAIANSAEEVAIFKELFAKHPSSSVIGGHKEVLHLGFYNWNGNGIWRTIYGESLEEAGYNQWSRGQPDHYENALDVVEQCGTMFRTGLLNDLYCAVPATSICEMDPSSALNNA